MRVKNACQRKERKKGLSLVISMWIIYYISEPISLTFHLVLFSEQLRAIYDFPVYHKLLATLADGSVHRFDVEGFHRYFGSSLKVTVSTQRKGGRWEKQCSDYTWVIP